MLANRRDASYLYTGARLQTVQEQLAANQLTLTTLAKELIDASVQTENERLQQIEAERQRELARERALAEEQKLRAEAERQRAEEQTQAAQRLRRLVVGLVVVALLTIAATGYALVQTRLVTGYNLALQAASFARDKNLRLATLLAIEARDLNPTEGDRVLEEIPYQVPFSLQRPLFGHRLFVNSVVWSPDGQQLASASGEGTIILWDATTGEQIRTLVRDGIGVNSVAWSPDGQQLASASADGTIILWNTTTWRQVYTFGRVAPGFENSVVWSPDGQQLASAFGLDPLTGDDTIIIWDAESGGQIHTLTLKEHNVNNLAWSPDGQQLASAFDRRFDDDTIIVWDAATWEQMYTLEGDGVAWSPDGQQLIWRNANRITFYSKGYLQPPCTWVRSNLSLDEWIRFRGWATYHSTCSDYITQSVLNALRNGGPSIHSTNTILDYLLSTVQGRLLLVGVPLLLLAVIVLPFWLGRRFLRWRLTRRLSATAQSSSA
jgi:hypothetical protein